MAIKERVYLTNIKWRGVGKKKKLTSKYLKKISTDRRLSGL